MAATIHLSKLNREEVMHDAFKHFDKDNSGFITAEELHVSDQPPVFTPFTPSYGDDGLTHVVWGEQNSHALNPRNSALLSFIKAAWDCSWGMSTCCCLEI